MPCLLKGEVLLPPVTEGPGVGECRHGWCWRCASARVFVKILPNYTGYTRRKQAKSSAPLVQIHAPIPSNDGADQWPLRGSDFSAFAHGSLTTAISWRNFNFMKFQLITSHYLSEYSNNQNKIWGRLSQWNRSYLLHLSSLLMTKPLHLHYITFWHLFVAPRYSVRKSNKDDTFRTNNVLVTPF